MVATLVGLAAAQAFGIGELADALLLIAGIGFCGWGAVDGCKFIPIHQDSSGSAF
jgi:hypothetical protein